MCGIVGYIGKEQAAPILLEGLARLEYRGYDSAGICVAENGVLDVAKCKGRLKNLAAMTENGTLLHGTAGIGHTRWATHGEPSDVNSHPHSGGRVTIVHNGIIENYKELKDHLASKGVTFASDTDTEVVAKLLDYRYNGSPIQTISDVIRDLEGSYALGIIFADHPDQVYAVRCESPLIVGVGKGESFIASDVPAIIEYTRDYYLLEHEEIAVLGSDGVHIYDAFGQPVEKELKTADWDVEAIGKNGYAHFMLKEIHEQPRVIRDTLAGRLVGGALSIDELDLSVEELNLIDRVYIIACGTSYHAGLIAKNLIEGWARIPCECEVASEFRYRNPIITPTTLVVAVSQSGETADTLAAIRDARVKGARVFGITNVVGSPVARESDGVIYTKANKEIAVASTKSFLGQVVSLTLLAMLLAQVKGKLKMNQIRLLFRELADTAEQVERILAECGSAVEEAAQACKDARSALFVGRGMGAAVSREGALKLKEISYLHAESYPAGEMKHGPIALIDEGFPVIAVATKSPVYDKLVSNLQESKARGAMVVAIATEGDEEIRKHADHVIYIPKVRDAFSAITASVPLQLLARAIAVARGCDVDQPRNLAKSVTVE